MITPEKFLKLIKDDDETIFKIGTVGLTEGSKARIIFDGESVESGKGYVAVGYTPSMGNRVLLASVNGTYVILGELGGAGGGGGMGNIDGGTPSSIYGGMDSIDGGGVIGS